MRFGINMWKNALPSSFSLGWWQNEAAISFYFSLFCLITVIWPLIIKNPPIRPDNYHWVIDICIVGEHISCFALLGVYVLLLQLHGYRDVSDDNFMHQNCCVMILLLLRTKYRASIVSWPLTVTSGRLCSCVMTRDQLVYLKFWITCMTCLSLKRVWGMISFLIWFLNSPQEKPTICFGLTALIFDRLVDWFPSNSSKVRDVSYAKLI